jgi:hypothetical protein
MKRALASCLKSWTAGRLLRSVPRSIQFFEESVFKKAPIFRASTTCSLKRDRFQLEADAHHSRPTVDSEGEPCRQSLDLSEDWSADTPRRRCGTACGRGDEQRRQVVHRNDMSKRGFSTAKFMVIVRAFNDCGRHQLRRRPVYSANPRHSQVCGGTYDRLPRTPRSVSGDAEDDTWQATV